MTRKQAIDILDQFNQWRRGYIEDLKVQPHNIGGAIDIMVKEETIFSRNFDAVVLRECINKDTTDFDFYEKANEELLEVHEAIGMSTWERGNEEITDLLCVCANWLIHRGVNPFDALEKNYEKNVKRVKTD